MTDARLSEDDLRSSIHVVVLEDCKYNFILVHLLVLSMKSLKLFLFSTSKKRYYWYILCSGMTICLFVFSYYASASFPPVPPRLVPPLKRPRLMVPPARPVIKATIPQKPQPTAMNQLKTYSKYTLSVLLSQKNSLLHLGHLLPSLGDQQNIWK
jgi:hypothetical protein